MSEELTVDALVNVYIKIRDARDAARKEADAIDADFQEQLEIINAQLLKICEDTGADSIKTSHGTAMRSIKSKYWTNDWERFYAFMFEHEAPELLERKIHQTNMKQFLEENPDILPAGLNMDRTYSITVRRSK